MSDRTPSGEPLDLDKLRSIGVLRKGRTRDRVNEGKDSEGKRWKSTTDQLGNTVTESHGDRQDVNIKAPQIVASASVREERD